MVKRKRKQTLAERLATARARAEALEGRHCVHCGAICRKGGGCARCGGESQDALAFRRAIRR